ncbi:V-set domain-containing T-cell activation inhibitor 1 isoform X1 [Anolis carolinensis]|uniref:V-set domain-containing T-cell activation inhibitor 1 isoform X1 n=1 Tax=Anolis carolinensis TaxID=28377 RepID=UPI002F2B7BE5
MFSRSSLKMFLWLFLCVLQSDSSGLEITVTAKVGDEAKLPCNCHKKYTVNELKTYTIYWQKPVGNGKKDLVVIAHRDGKDEPNRKDQRYQNRTKMNEQNLTLSIFSVQASDKGTYKCIIITNEGTDEESVNFSVVADFSKPNIYAEIPNGCDLTQLTLRCSSHGGLNKDFKMLGSINNKTEKWTVSSTTDNQTELLNVTGYMQLNVTENIVVQCSVVYAGIQISANFTWSISKECLLTAPPHGIIIASSVILVFLVAVLVVIFRRLSKYSCFCNQPMHCKELLWCSVQSLIWGNSNFRFPFHQPHQLTLG